MGNDIKATDIEILKLLAANDRKSISVLIDAHYKAVFAQIRSITGNTQDTEEILQDVFLLIWEKRAVLKLVAPLRPFLVVVAHNKAINLIKQRTRKSRNVVDIDSRSFVGITAHPEAEQYRQMNRELRAAIRRLPLKTRIPFIMSRNLGMTNRDIAKYLNLSVKTIEKHMSKAIRLLQHWLTISKTVLIFLTFKKIILSYPVGLYVVHVVIV